MKFKARLLCLLMTVLFVFSGCARGTLPSETAATADTVDAAVSETESADSEKDPEPEEYPEQDFDPSADPRSGVAVNVDCDAIWYMYASNGEKLENVEQMCIDWFDIRYKDAGISDIMYHIDQHTPSKTRQGYMDFYLEAQQTGEKLDDITNRHGGLLDRVYNEHKVDPYAIWFEQCRENGINPWLSFRMNDVHAPVLGYACTDFYYEAKENGWLVGTDAGWGSSYAHCLDYSVPEVRSYFLDYIDEMLGRYDVYGIELDWQRETICFKKDSKDNCQYMDIFMEDLNKIIAKYEQQYGHEIKIMARLARSLDANLYFGFDIVNWAKNDWLDIMCPASHGPTDSGVPVAEWKSVLDEYGVELYISLEQGTIAFDYRQTDTTLAAFTSMYLQQGADKIQLYNMFHSSKNTYKLCSTLENALKYAKRQYIVTSQTKVPKVDEVEEYRPLPVTVSKNAESDPVVIEHGYLDPRWDAYVYIGVVNKDQSEIEEHGVKVWYNGVECVYEGKAIRPHLTNTEVYETIVAYKIPKEAWILSQRAEITFTTDKYVRVGYVELMNGRPALG